jgi:hypothetical protein
MTKSIHFVILIIITNSLKVSRLGLDPTKLPLVAAGTGPPGGVILEA